MVNFFIKAEGFVLDSVCVFYLLCGAEKMSSVLQSPPNELVTRNYWQEEDSLKALGQYASCQNSYFFLLMMASYASMMCVSTWAFTLLCDSLHVRMD